MKALWNRELVRLLPFLVAGVRAMTRFRVVRRLFQQPQWSFLREQVLHYRQNVLELDNLKTMCQHFYWRYGWYAFPSELAERVPRIRRQKPDQPVFKKAFPVRRSHIVFLLRSQSHHPIRRPKARFVS